MSWGHYVNSRGCKCSVLVNSCIDADGRVPGAIWCDSLQSHGDEIGKRWNSHEKQGGSEQTDAIQSARGCMINILLTSAGGCMIYILLAQVLMDS